MLISQISGLSWIGQMGFWSGDEAGGVRSLENTPLEGAEGKKKALFIIDKFVQYYNFMLEYYWNNTFII